MRAVERRPSAPPIQRILAVVAGVMLLRIFLRRSAGLGAIGPGGQMRDRRRAMIARLHRELHAADDAATGAAGAADAAGAGEVTA